MMKTELKNNSGPLSPEVEIALDHLRNYERGSSRGLLVPVDAAAASASKDLEASRILETKLLAALESARSLVAREYICAKLVLVGGATCVPAMAGLLSDPALNTAARTVLEGLPDLAAGKALADGLSSLEGTALIGAINSLGVRGTCGPERILGRKLRDRDHGVASAACAALGEIGSVSAAKLLAAWVKSGSGSLTAAGKNAVLSCVEKLRANGKNQEAQRLQAVIGG